MKKLKLIPILALVFMLNVASMCSSDDSNDDNSGSSSNPTQVNTNATSGTWRVTLYNEDGSIQTSNFSGYAFTFASGGALTAVNGSTTQSGVWSTYSDSGSTKMELLFSATNGSFESISEDWNVLSTSASKIQLKHISGGDGSIDLLTFEKN
jgi:hypothetical protein